MIQAVVRFSLRYRRVVVVLAGLLLGYGVYAAGRAKLDVFPEFVPPQVVIQTEAPGLAPEQVELLVTDPIEVTLSGLGGLESLRSESIQGLSIVTAVFREGTDVFRGRQMLAERLFELSGRFPLGVGAPKLSPLTSSTMDILKIGLLSDTLSPLELRSFADWTLRPRLLAVTGVARANVFGGEVRQLQIQVDPARLHAHHLALSDVLAAARASTGVVGVGFVETENQRVVLQTGGEPASPVEIARTVVAMRDGTGVRLGDVARVLEGAEPRFGDTLIQGRPGVLLTLSSQYGANTLQVTNALEQALAEMQPVFDRLDITLLPRLHRPATFIETSLRNVRTSLLLGAVLVAGVLFLFLGHVRTALVSLAAIPLSLLCAVIGLGGLGHTLNTMTIGGLAIAIGEVVDDAIIDVENILRRLRENRSREAPRSAFRVVLDASLEVRRAVVFATFTVVLVFLPVLTLTGLQGSFFAPLALSYILAILASLGVALTLTPALSLMLFGGRLEETRETRLQARLRAGYRGILARVVSRPRGVAIGVGLVCVAALTRVPFLGGEFLPEFREGHFVLQVSAAPGTSIGEMLRIGGRISEALLATGRIATVEQQVGRAEQGEDTWGPERSEFHVELATVSPRQEAETADEIRRILAGFPGLQFEVLTFLGDRISETITGETAEVVVNVFGDDLDALDATAQRVAAVLRGVPGASDVLVKAPPGAPRMAVRLNPEQLAALGFRPLEVLEAVQTAYQGTVVARTHRANQVTDVTVVLEETLRQDPEAVGGLLLRSSAGLEVPLRDLAEVYPATGRHTIRHEEGRRRQTVTCSPGGRDVASFAAEARRAISQEVELPAGTYLVFGGTAEAQQTARRELLLRSALAAGGVLLLLSVVFGSWRNLMLLLANVPFALVGGVAALTGVGWLDPEQGVLSVGSLVGFVTLFGITTRNSIMLVSHFQHLVQEEGLAWNRETALRGACERLMPILMTALVTAFGLLPLAAGSGAPGREIEGPMAIVIVGGLVTSTALNLLVLPSLALRFGRFEAGPERSD